MVGALVLGGASMIALGLAERPAVIAPATLLVGFLGEMYRPGLIAALSDLVPAADRVRAFGLVYWAVNLGMAVVASVGGLLASISFLLLFIADGATTLVFGFLVWRWVPETRPGHGAPRPARPPGKRGALLAGLLAPYRDRVFLAYLGLTFVLALIFMQHQLALAVDMTAHGVTKAQFGSVLAVNGVLIVLFQPVLARATGGRDKSMVIAAGSVLVALGFGLNAVVHTPALYALGVVIWTFGEMATLPVGTALVADLSPPELRGRYQGASGLAFGLGSFVAPALGALVLQRLGSVAVWTGCLVAGLAAAAGQLALTGALRRAAAARASPLAPP
jgi:MFS family permease